MWFCSNRLKRKIFIRLGPCLIIDSRNLLHVDGSLNIARRDGHHVSLSYQNIDPTGLFENMIRIFSSNRILFLQTKNFYNIFLKILLLHRYITSWVWVNYGFDLSQFQTVQSPPWLNWCCLLNLRVHRALPTLCFLSQGRWNRLRLQSRCWFKSGNTCYALKKNRGMSFPKKHANENRDLG